MWFLEDPSQFSVGQTVQNRTCSIMEKPHTGLDDCLRVLLSCFRARNSAAFLGLARHVFRILGVAAEITPPQKCTDWHAEILQQGRGDLI